MAELTYQEFARMRTQAWRSQIVARGDQPVFGPRETVERFLEPIDPITHHAGDWVRQDGVGSNGIRLKWHRFTGDVRWSLAWNGLTASTTCAVRIGTWHREWSADKPTDDVCKRCERSGS